MAITDMNNYYPHLPQAILDDITAVMDPELRDALQGTTDVPGEFLTAYVDQTNDADWIDIVCNEYSLEDYA